MIIKFDYVDVIKKFEVVSIVIGNLFISKMFDFGKNSFDIIEKWVVCEEEI